MGPAGFAHGMHARARGARGSKEVVIRYTHSGDLLWIVEVRAGFREQYAPAREGSTWLE